MKGIERMDVDLVERLPDGTAILDVYLNGRPFGRTAVPASSGRLRLVRLGKDAVLEFEGIGGEWYPAKHFETEAPMISNPNIDSERWRKRNSTTARALIRVRCEGKIHTLAWTPRGRVTMLNHTTAERRALMTMKALGDQTCGCLKVMAMVKGEGRIWGEWRPLVRDVERVRAERRMVQEQQQAHTVQYRLREARNRTMNSLLSVAGAYRAAFSGDVEFACGLARPGIGPFIESFATHRFNGSGSWIGFRLYVTIVVDLLWLLLAAKGLHSIEGMVGIRARNVTDRSAEVLLGRVLVGKFSPMERPTVTMQWARVAPKSRIGPSLPKTEWFVEKWLDS